MIFGSICSGIEAASVAWGSLGWRAVWLAEIEAFPSAVLAHHYPDVPNVGDMMQIAELVRLGWAEAPDVLVGGTPCQAFSVAGLRGSLTDARGALTLEYIRILDEIDRKREIEGKPAAVAVWENVPGVLTTSDNAFGCFLAGLAGCLEPVAVPGGKWWRAGLIVGPSRTVAWRVLDAQYFGVAQRRRRVFVVASARNDLDPGQILFEFDGVRRDIAPSREARKETAAIAGAGVKVGSHWDSVDNPHPSLSQSHNTGGNGQSNQGLFSQRGAGIVPQICGALTAKGPATNGAPEVDAGHVFAVPCRQVAFGGYVDDDTASTSKARDFKSPADLVAYGIPGNWIGRAPENGGNATEPMYNVAPCQTRAGRHGVAYSFDALASNSMKSSNPHSGCREVNLAHTLDASRPDPSKNQGGIGIVQGRPAMQVRRLTPIECERLQGFPDGYTLVPVKGKPAADGPRYKALGNSMAVPVMAWIGSRIAEALKCQ